MSSSAPLARASAVRPSSTLGPADDRAHQEVVGNGFFLRRESVGEGFVDARVWCATSRSVSGWSCPDYAELLPERKR